MNMKKKQPPISKVIVNRQFYEENSGLIDLLPIVDSIIYSSTIDASLIYPDFKPSVAFIILGKGVTFINPQIIEKSLRKLQETFKNCTAIIIGQMSDPYWMNIVSLVPAGTLRFQYTKNIYNACHCVSAYFDIMDSSEKQLKQKHYFQQVL